MREPRYTYRIVFADNRYYKSKHDYVSVDCIAVDDEIDATTLTAEDVYYLADDNIGTWIEITLNDWLFIGRVLVTDFLAEDCPFNDR